MMRFSTTAHTEYLATPEQRAPIMEAARADKNWKAVPAKLAPFGTRTVWVIHRKCSGCGSLSTHYQDCFENQDDAEQAVAKHNELLETPEAKYQAEHWKEEVARRIAVDSQNFATLFCARFPHWSACLEPTEGVGLKISVPSENPSVELPLGIEIKNGEVLVYWVDGWHFHIFRQDNQELGSTEHLERALDDIEALITEKTVPVAMGWDGIMRGGGTYLPGTEIEWKGAIDQMQFRSWQGTYDQFLTKV
jgi:hypothetical protein